MRIFKVSILGILLVGVVAVSTYIWLGFEVDATEILTEVVEIEPQNDHPILQALSNLPRNTSLEENQNQIVVSQRLADESFVVTNLAWQGDQLYYEEQEIQLKEVSSVPYEYLVAQNPEQRVIQFNRELTRQEIFNNIRNQEVMTGLYLSSQNEVDNLVVETILSGYTLAAFYATENWLYALFSDEYEDMLIWWDGSHLTLAGSFRR